MKRLWLVVLLLSVLLGACQLETVCPADLQVQVDPQQVNLMPEETVQASYKVLLCGGTQEAAITPVWESADPAIATVSDTGLITAQLQGGNTEIIVSEDEYGTEDRIRVSVPIIDPVP